MTEPRILEIKDNNTFEYNSSKGEAIENTQPQEHIEQEQSNILVQSSGAAIVNQTPREIVGETPQTEQGDRSQSAVVNQTPKSLNFKQYITEVLPNMKALQIINRTYDDDVLKWNSDTDRYQLTLQYVKSLRDEVPYKNDRITQDQIKKTSLRVYNYIASHSNTANRQVINFLLNKTENGRKFLKEVLACQMEAEMEYAYNDLVVRPVINAVDGKEGDRDTFRLNAISIETEMLIEDSVNYFGINICYMGAYPWWLFNMVRQYEE